MQKPIKSICIVGGGTAGWMAASLLSSTLSDSRIKIIVVESPDIGTIGVGESTVPSIMEFLRVCQIDLKDFVAATAASFKLGIRFDDWLKPEKQYFHPFGRVGQELNGLDFYQLWLKNISNGNSTRWVDHSPCAIMAENQRFMLRPDQSKSWVLNSYSYALHVDAVLVARYLRKHSVARGIERIEATVEKVIVDEQQFISRLELNNGTAIEGDFFIDCTGFKGLLIGDALNIGYQNWGNYFPCDRAVAVQTSNTGVPSPFTIATARDAGWTWKIPLQHRTGNGYVFSSQYCSDQKAIDTLLKVVDGDVLIEPRVIPFATGRRQKIWHKNCLALGLASGFLEPLESTAIHLIYKTLVHFIASFPDRDFDPHTENVFNKKINLDYEEVRDFIILHYCTTKRDDTEFWRWCQSMSVPESLHEKMSLFRERGQIDVMNGQLFTKDSWFSILEGMNVRPKKYHPLMDGFESHALTQALLENAKKINSIIMQMPMHAEYIRQNCAANK